MTSEGISEFYDGSRVFQPISTSVGLSVDKVNFVVCHLAAVLLGFPFRLLLGPHKVSPGCRHAVEITVGVCFAYFCFGSQVVHLFLQSIISLLMMRVLDPGVMEKAVLGFVMTYLGACHIYRMIYDYGGYTLDITGPLMINTQRLSSLAFCLRDGREADESKLSDMLRKQAVRKPPSVLEYFSYNFSFHQLMCGPFCFYKDYIAFIEGTDCASTRLAGFQVNLLTRLLSAATFGLSTVFLLPHFHISLLSGPEFKDYSFFYKHILIDAVLAVERHKYYFAWKLSESANLSCGLGFSGYNPDGQAEWNLLDNGDILKIEFGTSPKVVIDNWNFPTTRWLKHIVYERWHSVLGVFVFSACWHGFYSGYYVCAGTVFLLSYVAKLLRRRIRPHFLYSQFSANVYDIITFVSTRISVAYSLFPFLLLTFKPAFEVYGSLFFWQHSVWILLLFLLTLSRLGSVV